MFIDCCLLAGLQDLMKTIDVCEPKVRFLLVNGESLIGKMPEESTVGLRQSLDSLKDRWENIQSCVTERRGKLEEALKYAENFQDILSDVTTWLNVIERAAGALAPVSRVLSTVVEQKQELKVGACQIYIDD